MLSSRWKLHRFHLNSALFSHIFTIEAYEHSLKSEGVATFPLFPPWVSAQFRFTLQWEERLADEHPVALGTADICNTLVCVQKPSKTWHTTGLEVISPLPEVSTQWSLGSKGNREKVISAHTHKPASRLPPEDLGYSTLISWVTPGWFFL